MRRWRALRDLFLFSFLRPFFFSDYKLSDPVGREEGEKALSSSFDDLLTALLAFFATYFPIEASIAGLLTSTFAACFAWLLVLTIWTTAVSKASRSLVLSFEIDIKTSRREFQIARRTISLSWSESQFSNISMIVYSAKSITRSSGISSAMLIAWSDTSKTSITVATYSIPCFL